MTLDRRDEALREIRRAHALDPLSGPLNAALSEIEWYVNAPDWRYPSPERRAFVDPAYKRDHSDRALALAADGRCAEARAELTRARELSPEDATVETAGVRVLLRCGDREGARALAARITRLPDARLNTTYIAMAYEALGQLDSAFAWLDREAYWGMVKRYELRTSMHLASLRADPRFPALLARVGMR